MGVSASIYGQCWESAGLCTPLIKKLLALNLHALIHFWSQKSDPFSCGKDTGGGSVSDDMARTKKKKASFPV